MEHLAQLFPEQDPDVLRLHLDGASGVLESAIDSLLNVPIERIDIATTSKNPGYPVYEGNLVQSNKRQRRDSIEYISSSSGAGSTQVYDLTLDSSDDDDDDDDDILGIYSFNPGHSHQLSDKTTSLPNFDVFHREQLKIMEDNARRAAEIEKQRLMLISNFVAIARDMFDNISEPYLVKLLEETRPKISSDEELVDTCIETIVKLGGQYPKAKVERKRPRQDDGEDLGDGEQSELDEEDQSWDGNPDVNGSGSNSLPKRDYMDYRSKMRDVYETQCATQLFQDFPMITAVSIRACLKKYNFHYAPAFDHLHTRWADQSTSSNGITLSLMNKPRTKKPTPDPGKLDPEFRRELQWVKAKIEKELKEIQMVEDEENNLRYYTERNELIECGCCYDEVPPNRMAQCEDGHLFCLECSRRGAEPIFQGLLRARQQNELKMAGLDSLVECPFCSYAAVVENDMDKEFRCQAPKCLKVSCRLCRAHTHIPLSCEEYRKELEQNNVLSAQHRVEEQMSQALIRELCRLWENTVERNSNEVKEAAQKSLLELQADKPELAAKVRLDIPK
ncbi:hypothetical protein BGX27_009792 [Mortierella sp. AM989]|nr:hypothetical protein BGX27_009792 [Mortierella sp. AM989]